MTEPRQPDVKSEANQPPSETSLDTLERMTKRRLATLYAMDRILTRASALEGAVVEVLEAVGNCEGWEAGTYWMVDEARPLLRCLGFWCSPHIHAPEFEALTRTITFPPAVGLPGRVLQERQAIWIPDVTVDPNFPRAAIAQKEGLHGGVGFPVWCGGRVVGVIEYFSPDAQAADTDLMSHYETVGLQLGQFIARKQADEALRQQYERLQRLDQLKDDLMFAISHELKTPLTSIFGYLEFMEDGIGGALSSTQREFVRQIRLSTKRLEHLVNDLLDYARLESGTFELNVEQVDFTQHTREVVDSLQPQAQEAGLDLTLDLPQTPLLVCLDANRIGQVLINLVGNAIKFTPPHGCVMVRARATADQVRCEVVDNGVGIRATDLPKLFKRFGQLDGNKKKMGTGLGLYISKLLIERHQGHIGVESAPGCGSTFWFTLPISGPTASNDSTMGGKLSP